MVVVPGRPKTWLTPSRRRASIAASAAIGAGRPSGAATSTWAVALSWVTGASSEPNVHVLRLRVGEQLLDVLLAPHSAVLDAPEGDAGEVSRAVVDPHEAGLHVAGEAVSGPQVAREDACGEPVGDAVG